VPGGAHRHVVQRPGIGPWALAAGADEFLDKGVPIEALRAAVCV
jgi:hypothetical protein